MKGGFGFFILHNSSFILTKEAYPRRESNSDRAFRKRQFYPLNYGDD